MLKLKKKVCLKLNTQKARIMASSSIASWQIDAETMETERFIFLGFKIIADGDCSHKTKRQLLLGEKALANQHIKSRDITLPTNVYLVKAIVFK